ncbi:helix-turn-helix transcriptional regulator [Phenylobacterium sp.]|uniref:helix-turn-helix transcriptional regulator n=1 Tax=Phenylobacterium sp. TaxID=1871053 RepID=UPI001225F0AB|nr:helix-turn-helix transcriptional regulator [Phenylobacterium sp.]THD59171.1 MAG: LuxR family transcriptional regulator [Phenylobacterium sp.]
MREGLIDRIYECAFAPESWPGVLDEISEIALARGGCLLTANSTVLHWTSSDSLTEVWDALARNNLMDCGDRFRRLVELRHSGFLTDQDGYADESEMAADRLYREVLWPIGLGWAVATAMPLPTGDTMVLTFERDRARGPVEAAVVEQLDALRPHLARSALLSARLQLERAKAAAEALALLGIPALVFNPDGRVLAANPTIEAMAGPIQWRARDRISLTDAAADALLQQAIATLGLDEAGGPPAVRSFAVRGAQTAAAMVAHVIPLRGQARDVFVQCAGVLVLTPVALPQAPPVELVQSLFDLTPAEARVARALSAGDTVDEIAASGGVSPTTIRNQVRGVLQKTGCHRQTEVVALLGGILNLN